MLYSLFATIFLSVEDKKNYSIRRREGSWAKNCGQKFATRKMYF